MKIIKKEQHHNKSAKYLEMLKNGKIFFKEAKKGQNIF